MADRMIVVSPDELMGGNFVPPQMVNDLLGVSSIDAVQIEKLSEALQAETGFLTEERLTEIVAEHIQDETQASAAASAIQNLRPNVLDQVLAMLGGWRESNQANADRFSNEAFAALQEKLPLLVREYPALSRMRKANRLRGVIGNDLEKVEFICDARPVFDTERERIEGLLALTTLKLVYERQNGVTEEVAILLTSEQLEDLTTKAQKAQKKIRVLEQSFAQWINETAE